MFNHTYNLLSKLVLTLSLSGGQIFLWGTAGLANWVVQPAETTIIKVYDRPIGISTRYIGACEGNVRFDLADLMDLRLNTYRIYGGMSRWEPQDDDGRYGYPSIAQIKANPNIIPWQRWDEQMGNPATGSDYAFSGPPTELWQGSARTIFATLKQAQIRPVVTLRNSDPGWQPNWALQLNPPRTTEDWNEWWQHVFATVYWLNVRNDYRVDDWEIHNEPDNRQQGWGGSQADYLELLRVGANAIEYTYRTYLPGRQFYVHAPKTVGGSQWPATTLNQSPQFFNSVNIHNYDLNLSTYVRQVRRWMQGTPHEKSPLWLGEWGTYTQGYDFSLNMVKNLIYMSQGETYVYGSHLFSLYDWGRQGDFKGLVNAQGDRRLGYYALRMGVRALQGGRPILLSSTTDSHLNMIASRDDQGKLYLLMVNDQIRSTIANVDFSQFGASGQVSLWELSARRKDERIAEAPMRSGRVQFNLSGKSAMLAIATISNSKQQSPHLHPIHPNSSTNPE
jgi:hypothetical protein